MRLGRREAVGNGFAGDGSAGRSGAGTCGWPDFDGSGWNQIVLEAQGLEHGGNTTSSRSFLISYFSCVSPESSLESFVSLWHNAG
jgi:hypothetical protein